MMRAFWCWATHWDWWMHRPTETTIRYRKYDVRCTRCGRKWERIEWFT